MTAFRRPFSRCNCTTSPSAVAAILITLAALSITPTAIAQEAEPAPVFDPFDEFDAPPPPTSPDNARPPPTPSPTEAPAEEAPTGDPADPSSENAAPATATPPRTPPSSGSTAPRPKAAPGADPLDYLDSLDEPRDQTRADETDDDSGERTSDFDDAVDLPPQDRVVKPEVSTLSVIAAQSMAVLALGLSMALPSILLNAFSCFTFGCVIWPATQAGLLTWVGDGWGRKRKGAVWPMVAAVATASTVSALSVGIIAFTPGVGFLTPVVTGVDPVLFSVTATMLLLSAPILSGLAAIVAYHLDVPARDVDDGWGQIPPFFTEPEKRATASPYSQAPVPHRPRVAGMRY